MRKKIFLLIFLLFMSCADDGNGNVTDEDIVYGGKLGTSNVALDANKAVIRTEESPIGNLLGDAIYWYITNKMEIQIDFAIQNSGGIRFNEETRKDGIYPAGDFTENMVLEILQFPNTIAVVELSGLQLKEILEHSVALIEESKGQFLTFSKGVIATFDISKDQGVHDFVSGAEKIDFDSMYEKLQNFIRYQKENFPKVKLEQCILDFSKKKALYGNSNGVKLSSEKGIYNF